MIIKDPLIFKFVFEFQLFDFLKKFAFVLFFFKVQRSRDSPVHITPPSVAPAVTYFHLNFVACDEGHVSGSISQQTMLASVLAGGHPFVLTQHQAPTHAAFQGEGPAPNQHSQKQLLPGRRTHFVGSVLQ
jgi:hypothetical protein